jgi:hypothetical protein
MCIWCGALAIFDADARVVQWVSANSNDCDHETLAGGR